jgi:hypothetical protein
MNNFLANKCEANIENGGFQGRLFRTRPSVCTDNSVSPQLTNPVQIILDEKLKTIATNFLN